MDLEIASTLAELERKLHELERALTAIGHGEDAAADGAALASEGPIGGSRLVDEAIEGGRRRSGVERLARAPASPGARPAGGLASSDRGLASTPRFAAGAGRRARETRPMPPSCCAFASVWTGRRVS